MEQNKKKNKTHIKQNKKHKKHNKQNIEENGKNKNMWKYFLKLL